MTISFLLPGPSIYPAGGYKVIFEYANRLAQEGYKVNVVYAGSLFWRKNQFYLNYLPLQDIYKRDGLDFLLIGFHFILMSKNILHIL